MFAATLTALLALLSSAHALSLTATRFALTPDPAALVPILDEAPHVLSLSSAPRAQLKTELLAAINSKAKNDLATLSGTAGDIQYIVPVTIGGQNFQVVVDTGSSDLWFPTAGFRCFNVTTLSPAHQSACKFGPTYNPGKSSTFQAVPDRNFNVTYGSGEFLVGSIGTEKITIAGLTVHNQTFGVINQAAWSGDGINSGLFGLAYPFITSMFNGSDPTKDDFPVNRIQYNPFFFTAIDEKQLKCPVFSIALDRGTFAKEQNSTIDKNKGYLGFGGVAPVKTTGKATVVPVQGTSVGGSATTHIFYAVDATYVFAGSAANDNTTAILDTGTTLNYLPALVAEAFNGNFNPPSVATLQFGYTVQCNATAPPLSVTINGVSFAIDPKDLIIPTGVIGKDGTEVCVSGVQDGGSPDDPEALFILGDVFLHNVVATFNLIANTIQLSERVPY